MVLIEKCNKREMKIGGLLKRIQKIEFLGDRKLVFFKPKKKRKLVVLNKSDACKRKKNWGKKNLTLHRVHVSPISLTGTEDRWELGPRTPMNEVHTGGKEHTSDSTLTECSAPTRKFIQ